MRDTVEYLFIVLIIITGVFILGLNNNKNTNKHDNATNLDNNMRLNNMEANITLQEANYKNRVRISIKEAKKILIN